MLINLTDYRIESHVHLYRQGGLNIAYDVNSGSLHLLDDATFAYIGEWIDYQRADPDELDSPESMLTDTCRQLCSGVKSDILRELAQLQAQQVLFSDPVIFEQKDFNQSYVKAICLHVAHDCNLRCGYCFAGMDHPSEDRSLMSLETGKKVLDFIITASGSRPHCEVDFFGGEPLLNWPVVKDLVLYGRDLEKQSDKKIKFTMTTNAVLFSDEIQDFAEKEGISVVLSMDGRPSVHDRMRPFADSTGSYDTIVDRVSAWMRRHQKSSRYATGTYSYVRGTYTSHNLDFYRDVLHLAGLGIERISLEPVVATGRGQCSYVLTEDHTAALCESYDILGEEARNGNFTFFHFNAGMAGVCLPKRLSGCGAGYEYLAVSPEGDLYPCHQFVGKEAFRMGSVYDINMSDDGFVCWKTDLPEKFRHATIFSKAECRECWARFSCSGGCHASNAALGGSLNGVYTLGCILQKKRLEVAYYLKLLDALEMNQCG
jgi:uncharacterized protein